MKKRTHAGRHALTYAKLQLAGGVTWGETILGETSLFVCQECHQEYHLRDGFDPSAFCDGCKDTVLDILAKAVLKARHK